MRSFKVYTSEGKLNTKEQRQIDAKEREQDQAPESYWFNSTKEELCLEYINSFIGQFQSVYKNRRTPFMIAENEFGIKKFVCTTLRPTQIPIPELYDLYECATFLAGYCLYEPLDPPTEYPTYLFSPTKTMDSNTGDSFDLATLMCSFLLGNGYDAYVVCGYAPRFITLRDQSKTICPLINQTQDTYQRQNSVDIMPEATPETTEDNSTYVPPDNSVKSSIFIATELERKRLASMDKFKLWISDPDIDEKKMMEEEKANDGKAGIKRLHCWVYVAAGRRDVKESVYVEPSTGRIYNVTNSPYHGIESLWNTANYWINLQMDGKLSEIEMDLSDPSGWEKLFLTVQKSNDNRNLEGLDNDNDLMDSSQQDLNDMNGKGSRLKDDNRYFDAPPTWVSPLSITRSRYLLKYPPMGKRCVQYYCAKADFFAKRMNSQGMVMRITLYLDIACTIVKEIHEWFENRQDKMYKRIRSFLDHRRHVEFYSPGSVGEVKKWTEYPGKKIEAEFYVNGRLDRLSKRIEIIGSNVTEYFVDRTDYLTYRSVELTSDPIIAGARQFMIPGGVFAHEMFVIKMIQEFDKDPTVVPGTDLSKRIFYVREGKAVYNYHFGKGQITGDVKTYLHTRGPSVPVMTEQALMQEIGLDDGQDALLEAAAAERECFTSVKSSFQQNDKIHEFRRDVEVEINFEKTVFDVALDNVELRSGSGFGNENKGFNNESKANDYLTPFLRNIPDISKLTKDEALEIRQACLDALKARLVERANIIQTRLHEENAKLARKQEQFQRSQREGDLSTEEYERYCTEAMFRIQILEMRLSNHEDAALKKFADLDSKLSLDPRLKVLKT